MNRLDMHRLKQTKIPVKWIYKWTEQFYKEINGRMFYTGDGYDTVWDMLEAWEAENDKENDSAK